jgi:phosphate transport system substrate-binding protein
MGAVLLLAGAAQFQASPPAAAAPAAHLRLAGSSTMAPLMAEVAKRFQRYHPGVRIDIAQSTSGHGLQAVRDRRADIGMVSRALAAQESTLYGIPIARDGVAVVVHRDNPLSALDAGQLADIYRGKTVNWRQLGGADGALHLLAGNADSGSTELMEQYMKLPFGAFRGQRSIGANAERIRAVAADPLAIVYVSLGEAERNARAGVPIKLLALDGVPATSANIRNVRYPVARPLTLVMLAAPSGAARTFTQYCATSEISDLVLAHDFVPYLD